MGIPYFSFFEGLFYYFIELDI